MIEPEEYSASTASIAIFSEGTLDKGYLIGFHRKQSNIWDKKSEDKNKNFLTLNFSNMICTVFSLLARRKLNYTIKLHESLYKDRKLLMC